MKNRLFIEKSLLNKPLSQNIIKKLNSAEKIIFTNLIDLKDLTKKDYVLTTLKGKALKACPGTTLYSCCNYQILNVGLNCTLGCSYCILQDYLKTKAMIIFVDIEEYLHQEVQTILATNQKIRIGTGEYTDSLIIDHLTDLSKILIEFFRPFPQKILELKTKSININNILATPPAENIIISWSLNPDFIQKKLEVKTPSIQKRLEAAQKVCQAGYSVGFHLDPIILYPDWEKDYLALIEQIFKQIPYQQIRWISLGSLRFTKGLKPIFIERSPLFNSEFILADDQKFRYLRFYRVKQFKLILNKIRSYNPNQFVYLCMESQAVWEQVFGFSHKNNQEFEKWFNQKTFTHLQKK